MKHLIILVALLVWGWPSNLFSADTTESCFATSKNWCYDEEKDDFDDSITYYVIAINRVSRDIFVLSCDTTKNSFHIGFLSADLDLSPYIFTNATLKIKVGKGGLATSFNGDTLDKAIVSLIPKIRLYEIVDTLMDTHSREELRVRVTNSGSILKTARFALTDARNALSRFANSCQFIN